jgi:hypothetical protein
MNITTLKFAGVARNVRVTSASSMTLNGFRAIDRADVFPTSG